MSTDHYSGVIVVAGKSEAHLETAIDRLTKLGVKFDIGAPQVGYRETITRAAEIDYIHRKLTGAGQFARVKLRFEPMPPGSGFVFESKVAGDIVPKEYVLGVEKGLRAAAEDGIIAGFSMIDLKAELFDGVYHEVDSSALVFEIAARAAFKDGVVKAAPRLLEPIMRVEVVTPDDYMGDVIGDLNNRRGQVTGMDSRDIARVIEAIVPLANMFGYPGTLRSIGRGQATFTMRFERYALVPRFLDDDPPPAVAMRG